MLTTCTKSQLLVVVQGFISSVRLSQTLAYIHSSNSMALAYFHGIISMTSLHCDQQSSHCKPKSNTSSRPSSVKRRRTSRSSSRCAHRSCCRSIGSDQGSQGWRNRARGGWARGMRARGCGRSACGFAAGTGGSARRRACCRCRDSDAICYAKIGSKLDGFYYTRPSTQDSTCSVNRWLLTCLIVGATSFSNAA